MRRFAVLIALLTPLATAAASPAQAPLPSVPACALGGGDRALRAFYKAELARAERRFGGSRAQRRAFSAAVAAYVYGLPPVAVCQTVQRFRRTSSSASVRWSTRLSARSCSRTWTPATRSGGLTSPPARS
jgi:hypothetical protein